jgi:hypothetical protein
MTVSSFESATFTRHWPRLPSGTGLVDGFPPGGVDARDVCLSMNVQITPFLSQHRRMNSSVNFRMTPLQSASMLRNRFYPESRLIMPQPRIVHICKCLGYVRLYTSKWSSNTPHQTLLICTLYTGRHQNFAPRFNGRYLSSNVNITVADKDGNPTSIPVGSAVHSPH